MSQSAREKLEVIVKSCFDQVMALSNVKNLEKQAKYVQEE